MGQVKGMNPFLLALSVFAVLITPLSLRLQTRLGEPFRWELSLFVLGVKCTLGRAPSRKDALEEQEKQNQTDAEKQDEALEAVRQVTLALRLLTGSKALRGAIRWALQLQCVRLNVRVALRDAAQNALLYALLDTLLGTLRRLAALPPGVHVRLTCDWHSRSPSAEAMGILFSRLGILLGAGAVWLATLLTRRAQKAGGQHAASH